MISSSNQPPQEGASEALRKEMPLLPTTKEAPSITIAILNWNGKTLLERFLPSILQHSPEETAKVVVIDNGSRDGSLALLKTSFPKVEILAYPTNAGFAGGYNRAMEEIATPFVCILNNDIEVTEGWLDAPLRLLESNNKLAAVQPKILAYRNRDCFEYAGAAGGFIDKHGYPYCRGRLFDTVEQDNGQYDSEIAITWATGAALFVRREAFCEVGGFDELFFAHMEEIDLAWRLRRAGYSLRYTPHSHIYHVGGASLNAVHPKKTYLNYRNNLLMLYKNLPHMTSRKILRVRALMDYLSALKYFISGKISLCKAVVKARHDFNAMKGLYLPAPTPATQAESDASKEILAPFSIVWQYFVRGKKVYSALPHTEM